MAQSDEQTVRHLNAAIAKFTTARNGLQSGVLPNRTTAGGNPLGHREKVIAIIQEGVDEGTEALSLARVMVEPHPNQAQLFPSTVPASASMPEQDYQAG